MTPIRLGQTAHFGDVTFAWTVTDMFVFLPVFIGAGLTVGLAWGNAIRTRTFSQLQ